MLRGEGSGPIMIEVRREWDRAIETPSTEAEAAAGAADVWPTSVPKPVLGTMTFGWSKASKPVDVTVAAQMLQTFLEKGGREIDGARMYAEGESEVILQKALSSLPLVSQQLAQVATKANPDREAGGSGMGGLSAEGLSAQISASLQALDAQVRDGRDRLVPFHISFTTTLANHSCS